MRLKTITRAIVFTVAMAGLLGPALRPTSAQQIPTSRHPECGCYICGKLIGVDYPDKAADCSGLIGEDVCMQKMATWPADKVTTFCDKIKAKNKFTSFKASCPQYAKVCEPPPKKLLPPNCVERSERDGDMPWFNPSAPGCQNLQDTEFKATFTPGKCTFTLRACGRVVLSHVLNVGATREFSGTREECNESLYFRATGALSLPQKVCCDIWQEAGRAGACNPERDVDCDGDPNETDWVLHIQDSFYAPHRRTSGEEVYPAPFNSANFDPRPPGLEWDEVMPNEPCKECKWMALSGKLTCSPDGRKDHEYKVTWQCPTSGVERVVTKRVPATFPCTPPNRPRPTGQ